MTLRLVALIALLALVAANCQSDGEVAAEIAEVRPAEVVETVAAPASVEPEARASVTAPVSGEIVAVLVDDGDEVTVDTPVLRLASEDLDAAIAQAEAGIAAADALAGVQPAIDLSPLFAALREQVKDTVPPVLDTLAVQSQDIDDPLLRDRINERIDTARQRYEETIEDLEAAEADAAAAARRSTASQRAAADAQRRQAEAALDAARSREDDLVVSAPIDGVVEFASSDGAGARPDAGGLSGDIPGDLPGGLPGGLSGGLSGLLGGEGSTGRVAVGARVGAGQSLFTVYDLSTFHVAAQVDEVDAVGVRAGQRATVFLDAFPDRSFAAQVSRVGVAPASGAAGGVVYPVTAQFVDPPQVRLRVGMTASVDIAVKRVRSETVVPVTTLTRRDGQDTVLVVRDDDGGRTVSAVPVRIVAIGTDDAAVEGDLEPGDEVVASDLEDLEDGDRLP